MQIINVPIFEDYKCPHCGKVTSKFDTGLQCECYKEKKEIVNLGGIIHGLAK